MSKIFEAKTHVYEPWHDEADLSQTISKFMVESAYACATRHWRADVKIMFGKNTEFNYEFSSGGAVTSEELDLINVQDRLHIEFFEVFLGEIGLPDVKLHTAEIVLYVKEDDGTRNIAVEESLYRTFATNFFRAVELFPKRLFKGRCIRSGKEYVY